MNSTVSATSIHINNIVTNFKGIVEKAKTDHETEGSDHLILWGWEDFYRKQTFSCDKQFFCA